MKKGLRRYDKKGVYELTRQEKSLIDAFLDPENVRLNITQICDKAGISTVTYRNAISRKGFRDHLNDAKSKLLDNPRILQAINNLIEKAKKDKNAAPYLKILLQLTGDLIERKESKVASVRYTPELLDEYLSRTKIPTSAGEEIDITAMDEDEIGETGIIEDIDEVNTVEGINE